MSVFKPAIFVVTFLSVLLLQRVSAQEDCPDCAQRTSGADSISSTTVELSKDLRHVDLFGESVSLSDRVKKSNEEDALRQGDLDSWRTGRVDESNYVPSKMAETLVKGRKPGPLRFVRYFSDVSGVTGQVVETVGSLIDNKDLEETGDKIAPKRKRAVKSYFGYFPNPGVPTSRQTKYGFDIPELVLDKKLTFKLKHSF